MKRIVLRQTLCEHIIEVNHVVPGQILYDVPEHIIEVNHVVPGQILCDVSEHIIKLNHIVPTCEM
jgi:hypothetical protein